jgi:hypothetical protein
MLWPILIANGLLETTSAARPRHGVTSLFFAIVCTATLVGCAEFNGHADSMPGATSTTTHRSTVASRKPKIPLPDRALLKPQDEPDCGLQVAQQTPNNDERAATSGTETGSISRGGPSTELAQRIALEYERECYRMAEARVRARLRQLQFSMARMARAVRNAEQGVR